MQLLETKLLFFIANSARYEFFVDTAMEFPGDHSTGQFSPVAAGVAFLLIAHANLKSHLGIVTYSKTA